MGNAYKALLRDAKPGTTQGQLSHSRRGEYCDNALPGTTQAESRWSNLKAEELEARDWPVFADLAEHKPASPIILTIVIMSVATPALAIRSFINFTNNLSISPHSTYLTRPPQGYYFSLVLTGSLLGQAYIQPRLDLHLLRQWPAEAKGTHTGWQFTASVIVTKSGPVAEREVVLL